MPDRRLVAIFIVILTVGSVSGLVILFGNPMLSQIPPPAELPSDQTHVFTSGNIVVWAEAEYWQDFMPVVDQDHSFYTSITVNITNIGNYTIEYVSAIRTTIYFNGTTTPFVTLDLEQAYQTFAPITISPNESVIIEYTNDRSRVFSPTIDEGTALYSQILFKWIDNAHELVLTTSPTELFFTY